MRYFLFVMAWAFGTGAVLIWMSDVRGETPWQKMSLFKKVDADPNKEYPLTESEGPWMIMAVTFSGDTAEKEARELVYELRSRFKLPAYTHRMHFDYTQTTSGKGTTRYGTRQMMRHRIDEIDEIAVLVGSYPTADDPEAKKTLEKLKYAEPDCMNLAKLVKEGEKTSRSLAAYRLIQQAVLPGADKHRPKGPMGHAFITSNPLLPEEYFVPKGLDPLVIEMNKGVKYSLLDCPGTYTVQVATFTGQTVVDQAKIEKIQKGEAEVKSRLAEAAEKAHLLTEALRAKGYLAFEFHDRGSSIVTVGSFDSVGTPRADGKTEINPQLHAIMETFGAPKTGQPGQMPTAVGQAKSMVGIPFDIQPQPVYVPRKSIDSDYRREPILSRR